VLITDNANATVYSGSAISHTTTIRNSRLPISISVSPSAPFVPYFQSNITNASNLIIELQTQNPTDTNPVNITVTDENDAVYNDSLVLIVYDVDYNVVFTGYSATYVTDLPQVLFPISVTATPDSASYMPANQSSVFDASNLVIQLVLILTSPVNFVVYYPDNTLYYDQLTVTITDSYGDTLY
jgi:hypothetical protein